MTRWQRWLIIGLVLVIVAVVALGQVFARDRTIPDPRLTPGVSTLMSVEEICDTAWGTDARHVSTNDKQKVFHRYDLEGNNDASQGCRKIKKRRYEIDHCISRELGGADDLQNLWPQCYSGQWNASMKDRLENRLHKELCAGNLMIDEAQAKVCANDWRKAYIEYFGNPYE